MRAGDIAKAESAQGARGARWEQRSRVALKNFLAVNRALFFPSRQKPKVIIIRLTSKSDQPHPSLRGSKADDWLLADDPRWSDSAPWNRERISGFENNGLALEDHVEAAMITMRGQDSWLLERAGAPGRIRTGDNQLRRLGLYPTELRAPFFTGMRTEGRGLRTQGIA